MIRKNFTGTTKAECAEELYDFLKDNSSEYFDEVEWDDDTGCIVCSVDGKTVLTISSRTANTDKSFTVSFDAGTTQSSYSYNDIPKFIIKTNKGIYIQWRQGSSNTNSLELFICHDKNGILMFVSYGPIGSSSTNIVGIYDIYGANAYYDMQYLSGKTSSSGNSLPLLNWYVTMAEIPNNSYGTTVVDGLYILVTSPLKSAYIELSVGDKNYVSNGILALED